MKWLKFLIARVWSKRLMKSVKPADLADDFYRQKWTFLQGQVLTRGGLRWNWTKVSRRLYKKEMERREKLKSKAALLMAK